MRQENNEASASKRKLLALILIFILVTAAVLIFRKNDTDKVFQTRRLLMDTSFRVKIVYKEGFPIEGICDSIFNSIDSIGQSLDFHSESSELYELNTSTDDTIKLTGDVLKVFEQAFSWRDHSDGRFDPGIGRLTALWGIPNKGEFIPSQEMIANSLVLCNLAKSSKICDGKLIKQDDAIFDLGGILKGYVLEEISKTLDQYVSSGIIKEYLVDAGRSVQGRRPGSVFKIGIAHPRENDGILASFDLPDSFSCATCGDYERYFIKDGIRYHHIIDPGTGYPADKSLAVTIIGKSATACDALSTAIFVMGPLEGIDFLNRLSGYDGIVEYMQNDTLKISKTNNFDTKYNVIYRN